MTVCFVIIHHKNAFSPDVSGNHIFRFPAFLLFFKDRRKPERRSLALFAFNTDPASHHLAELPGNGKPQACAAVLAGGR